MPIADDHTSELRLYNRAIAQEEAKQLYYGDSVTGLRIVKWAEVPNPE